MKPIAVLFPTLLALGLNACGSAAALPAPTPVDAAAIQTAAMQTAIVELTRRAPTATPTPTLTPSPTLTSTPTATPTGAALKLSLENNLAIYMTNVIDAQTCKYETLPIPVNHGFTGDLVEDVRLSVAYLLNTKWQSSGYLTNPLSISNLYVAGVEIIGTEMRLSLGGVLLRHEDQCLNEQARDQLWATVWTAVGRYEYPVVKTISIWVDIFLFDDIMLRG